VAGDPNDPESEILFVLNGIERSGTIWTTRLLAETLEVGARSRFRDKDAPFLHNDDPAVWVIDRPGKFIRRLHFHVRAYPYDYVPCVILTRDPRDVAVSQYEAAKLETGYDDYAERLLPLWQEFHLGWLADERAAAWLRYEDLLDATEAVIDITLTRLGLSFDMARLVRAVDENSFGAMQNRHKGRYGKAGNWQDHLSPGCADRLWAKYRKVMTVFGYTKEGVSERWAWI